MTTPAAVISLGKVLASTSEVHAFDVGDDAAALVDGLLDPFYALDADFCVTLFNRAAEEHFGLKRAEVLGRCIWDLFPGQVGGEFDRRFRQVLETGVADVFETASIARADSVVLFRVSRYRSGLAISFRNITPVRRTEEALRQSQARLEIATTAAEIGVWDWNLVTNEMVYSERAKAVYGFSPGLPVTFEQVRDATHPDDYPETSAQARRATDPEQRDRRPYEYRIIRPSDGQVRWLLAHGEAVFSKVGEFERAVRYVGTIQDITERKQAEEAVRASERRLVLAVEAGRMAVWEYDVATDSVQGSPELNRLLGFPPEATPTASEMRARYYPGEQERLQEIGTAALQRGDRFFEAEYRYVWPDGDVRWLMLRAEIILSVAQAPERVIGVVLDVTERKRAESRQDLLINELNHRVKNTLATVQALARQSFRDGTEGGPSQAFEVRLLALSRANDLLTRRNWTGASLREIVDQALAPYAETGTDRVVVAGPDIILPPNMSVSLALALGELCTNAAKYGALSTPTGRVSITWSVDEQGTQLKLTWTERGGPPVRPPERRGFGSRLIERLLAQDLNGEVRLAFDPEGVTCTVEAVVQGQ
ncbi:sensor histidine kinase [Salinarimonas soli]|uniref:Blue-light-activated histidine kinase n=1 Tax=Salinarimonas soli TaxID=1638099 RepID=A0A5B2V2T0_9HYPH|nr:PAS domain S-box protein [Salinarimonas soli]KAA2233151.1 PAS domain S-box protein [Salinarimonas soli]